MTYLSSGRLFTSCFAYQVGDLRVQRILTADLCLVARVCYNCAVMGKQEERKTVTVNRKARHEYSIDETYDAGIALVGTEVKSIRAGRVNLQDSYVRIEDGEAWVHNMHISPYEQGNRWNVDPKRRRKLLLHKREIDRLMGKYQERGMAIIPLSIYLERGYVKLQIGVGKGKKLYDRREAIAEREVERDKRRQLAERG
jgi:SsrA-binding protein